MLYCKYSSLIKEKNFIDLKKFREERFNEIKNNYNEIFSKIFNINFKNIKCELCNKHKNIGKDNNLNKKNIFSFEKQEKEPICFCVCKEHNYHLIHMTCLSDDKNYNLIV